MPKARWPTKAVMTQIYEQHFWGGKDYDFYSGEGSYEPKIITPYINSVVDFLKTHGCKLTVCDWGCGDFNIGKHLVSFTKYYYAIDIVDALIERNKKHFNFKNLEFHCLDIAEDHLPKADVVILRQVLQHLSNTEIEKIISKFNNYKYLILTEHIPLGNFTANLDKITNLNIRLKQQSGVDILKSPFNFKVNSHQILNEVILEKGKGRIVTTLYKL